MGARRVLVVAAALLVLTGAVRAADQDGDGVADEVDNCPLAANPEQVDSDADTAGNSCDLCVRVADPDQEDDDEDGVGDACDRCLDTEADVLRADQTLRLATDLSGCSVSQSCPCEGPFGRTVSWGSAHRYRACVGRRARRLARLGRIDFTERRAFPNLARESDCGTERGLPGDRDGDGVPDDGDESGVAGDLPCTGGAVTGCDDNCLRVRNLRQHDLDHDGIGDACDHDIDGDGFRNSRDSCPRVADRTRADADHDGVGNACDRCPDTPEAEDVDGSGCADGQTPEDAAAP